VDDMGPVRRSIQYMLDYFMDKPFENQSVSAISEDLMKLHITSLSLSATFTFVMRAFSTLEVGRVDPEFNFMKSPNPLQCRL